MKSVKNIVQLIRQFHITTNAAMDEKVREDVLGVMRKSKQIKSADSVPNTWRIIIKSRIAQVAAAVVVVLVMCWLTMSDRGGLKQQDTNRPAVAVRSETPAELVSAISLSMAFRDGDMEAMEKLFDKAEKKVKAGLKERITIDQLLCELEECEEIQERETL